MWSVFLKSLKRFLSCTVTPWLAVPMSSRKFILFLRLNAYSSKSQYNASTKSDEASDLKSFDACKVYKQELSFFSPMNVESKIKNISTWVYTWNPFVNKLRHLLKHDKHSWINYKLSQWNVKRNIKVIRRENILKTLDFSSEFFTLFIFISSSFFLKRERYELIFQMKSLIVSLKPRCFNIMKTNLFFFLRFPPALTFYAPHSPRRVSRASECNKTHWQAFPTSAFGADVSNK